MCDSKTSVQGTVQRLLLRSISCFTGRKCPSWLKGFDFGHFGGIRTYYCTDRVTVGSRELGQAELLPLYVFSIFMMSHTEEKAFLSQLGNSDKQLRQGNRTFGNIRELWIELKSYAPPRKLQVGKTVQVQFWGWKERNSTSEALKNASSMWLKDVHHMDLNRSAFREQWHQRIILNFWSPMSPGSGRGSKRPEINFPAFIVLASVFILVLIPRSSFSKDPLKKITSNTQMTLFIYMND